jgi:hypothetical protein
MGVFCIEVTANDEPHLPAESAGISPVSMLHDIQRKGERGMYVSVLGGNER